jgi:lysine 2,3-aminomutase
MRDFADQISKRASGERRWNDWRWQISRALRSPGQLAAALPGCREDRIAKAHRRFPLLVTPYYLALAASGDRRDPIRRMFEPDPLELSRGDGLLDDPIDEERHAPLPGVVRRYPDRALLLVSGGCAVHCRHCTRRVLGRGRIRPLDADGFEHALEFLRANPEIRDVIVSGGDALLLDDERLLGMLDRIRAIPSVEIIRLGTRALVALPMRVTPGLARGLAERGPIYVNTQFNHPREVTPASAAAAAALVDAGVPVASQSVLLAGVNDAAGVVEELCRALLRIRVRPYYLFVGDLVAGTGHLRAPLSAGVEIIDRLRGRLGGLGIPQLVVDLPGGHGKVPVGPEYVVRRDPERTVFRAPDGTAVEYPEGIGPVSRV